MKKLLTILCLALALTLVCGSALAATTYHAKYDTRADYLYARRNGIEIGDRIIYVDTDDLASVKPVHGEYVTVKAVGHTLNWNSGAYADDEGDLVLVGYQEWGEPIFQPVEDVEDEALLYQQGEDEGTYYNADGEPAANPAYDEETKYNLEGTTPVYSQDEEESIDGVVYYKDGEEYKEATAATRDVWTVGGAEVEQNNAYRYTKKAGIAKGEGKAIADAYTMQEEDGTEFVYEDGTELYPVTIIGTEVTAPKEVWAFADDNDRLVDEKAKHYSFNDATEEYEEDDAGTFIKNGEEYFQVEQITVQVFDHYDYTLQGEKGDIIPAGTPLFVKADGTGVQQDEEGEYYSNLAAPTADDLQELVIATEAYYEDEDRHRLADADLWYKKADALLYVEAEDGEFVKDENGEYIPVTTGDGFLHDDEGNKLPTQRFSWGEWPDLGEENIGVEVSVLLDPHLPKLDANGHEIIKSIADPTCEGGGYTCKVCRICGIDIQKTPWGAHGHVYQYVWVKEPTCTADGYRKLVCSICGDEKPQEKVDKYGHDYTDEIKYWKIDKPVICAENSQKPEDLTGYAYKHVCKRCGGLEPGWDKERIWFGEYAEYLEATGKIAHAYEYDGHDWDKWTAGDAATCAHPEQEKRWCKRCNLIEVRDKVGGKPALKANYKVYLPLGAHVNCTDVQNVQIRCTNCNGTYGPHQVPYVEWWLEDDDNIAGWIVGYDWDWNEVARIAITHQYKEIAGRPHRNEDNGPIGCLDDEYAWMRCEICDREALIKVADYKGHVWGDWEETEPLNGTETALWTRYCKVCHTKEVKAQDHKPVICPKDSDHLYLPVDMTKITCGEVNKNVALKCKYCDATKTGDFELKHNYVDVKVITEPTCTKVGAKLQMCDYCKDLKTVDVPMIAHTIVEVPAVAATCNKTGTKAAFQCTVCKTYFADKAGKTPLAALEVIPVDDKAHVWGEAITTKAPTCEAAGAGLKVCTVCKTSEEVVIPATGHEWGEWEVTTPATLEKDGVATRVCKKDASHKETKPVKFEATDPAKYEVKDLDYTSPMATGSAKLDPATKALDKAYARVTFFCTSGDCMIQIVELDKDGKFTAGATGNFDHIAVVIVDTEDAYDPADVINNNHGSGAIEL